MKKTLLIISLMISLKTSFCQDMVKGTLPPSPTAASLGKYSNYPVNLFTGLVSVSIPLFELVDKDLKLPISINYHASGIKVEEIASSVGLGWSLNAGGVITRTVRGGVDENCVSACPPWGNNSICQSYNDEHFQDYETVGIGYFWVGKYIQDELLFNNWCINTANIVIPCDPARKSTFQNLDYYNRSNIEQAYYTQISHLNLDTEPDLFTFSFNGYTGSFFLDENQKVIQIPNSNLIINVSIIKTCSEINCQWHKSIQSFTIITPDGYKYTFDALEKNYNNTNFEAINHHAGDPVTIYHNSYISSWYLTKIVSPSNNNMNFIYTEEISGSNRIIPRKTLPDTDRGKILEESLWIKGMKINKIETENYNVVFEPSNVFVNNYNNKAIERIVITNKSSNYQRSFRFDYSYFLSPLPVGTITSNEYKYKRLKLEKISESYNGSELPPTHFTYNEANSLPSIESLEMDLWGYYNANGATTSLIPQIYIYPQLDKYSKYRTEKIEGYSDINNTSGSFGNQYILTGTNRAVNTIVNQAWALNQIKFSTGGTKTFEYESNQYYDESIQKNVYCGGLRIKKQTIYNGLDHSKDIIEEYYYNEQNTSNSSGRLINKPVYAFPICYADGHYTNNNQTYVWDYNYLKKDQYPENDLYAKLTMRTSQSQNGLEEFQGSPVGYRVVTVKRGKPGSSTYFYSFPLPFGRSIDSESFPEITLSKPLSDGPKPTSDLIYDGDYCLPYPPNNLNIWRGYLIKRIDYSTNNNPVCEVVFKYTGIQPINSYTIKPAMKFYKGLSGFYYVFYNPFESNRIELTKKTEKIYSLNDPTKFIENKVDYIYNNYGLVKEETSTQSDGSFLIKKMKYISDLTIPVISNNCVSEYNTCRSLAGTAYDNCLMAGTDKLDCQQLRRDMLSQCDINFNSCTPNYPEESKMISKMQSRNMLSNLIEAQSLKMVGSDTKLVSGSLIKYKDFGSDILKPYAEYKLDLDSPSSDIAQASINSAGSFVCNENYKPQIIYSRFDPSGNLIQLKNAISNTNSSYIWGYNNQYLISEVKNASYNEIYFEGFEAIPEIHTWSFEIDNGFSKTGSSSIKSLNTSSSVNYYFTPFLDINNTSTKKYRYSCWAYSNGPSIGLFFFMKPNTINDPYASGWETRNYTTSETNKWTYLEGEVEVPSNMKQIYLRIDNNGGGTVWFDDLRLCPSDAQMTTFTYEPLFGISSVTDNNNKSTYYNYDDYGRLALVRDDQLNVLKRLNYHYSGQPTSTTIANYTITTSANSGGTITPINPTVVNGESVTITITPIANYHIKNVNVNGVSVGAPTSYTFSSITSNKTIDAEFEVDTYIVTFNSQGGNTVASLSTYYNSIIAVPTPPTKTGYTFDGWYKEAACTNTWVFSSDVITVNRTLYAKWTANSYTISFDSQGGSAIAPVSANYNTAISSPVAPTKSGYAFGGWYKEATCSNAWVFSTDIITADMTLYAKWATNVCTVSFNSQGGSAVAPISANYNSTILQPVPPTKSGYIFGGWYKEALCINEWAFSTDIVTSNITLYAKWTVSVLIKASKTGNGTISPSGVASYVEYGGNMTYSFYPSPNNYVKNVKVNGVSVGAVSSYTLYNVTEMQNISVEFAEITGFLNVSTSNIEFPISGGTSTFTISSNVFWRITAQGENFFLDPNDNGETGGGAAASELPVDGNRLTISTISGSNNADIIVQLSYNVGNIGCIGVIAITGGGITRTINVLLVNELSQ